MWLQAISDGLRLTVVQDAFVFAVATTRPGPGVP
jgi:hypothetical protein